MILNYKGGVQAGYRTDTGLALYPTDNDEEKVEYHG